MWHLLVTSFLVVISQFTFQPLGCEYSIVFEINPRIYQLRQDHPLLGKDVQAYEAEINLLDNKVMLRAECATLSQGDRDILKDYNIVEMTKRRAKVLNLQRAEYGLHRNALGFISSVYGIQYTERGPTAIEITTYLGDRSIFTVYLSSQIEIWPPDQAIEFVRSITRHPVEDTEC